MSSLMSAYEGVNFDVNISVSTKFGADCVSHFSAMPCCRGLRDWRMKQYERCTFKTALFTEPAANEKSRDVCVAVRSGLA